MPYWPLTIILKIHNLMQPLITRHSTTYLPPQERTSSSHLRHHAYIFHSVVAFPQQRQPLPLDDRCFCWRPEIPSRLYFRERGLHFVGYCMRKLSSPCYFTNMEPGNLPSSIRDINPPTMRLDFLGIEADTSKNVNMETLRYPRYTQEFKSWDSTRGIPRSSRNSSVRRSARSGADEFMASPSTSYAV